MCPVLHDGLPVYLSHELEAVLKRAMGIIFPCFMYDEALVKASLVTLSDQRQDLTDKLFKKILDIKDSKLRNLLPPQNAKHSAHQVVTSVTAHTEATVFWPDITPAITASLSIIMDEL